jgi:hypothetical protein
VVVFFAEGRIAVVLDEIASPVGHYLGGTEAVGVVVV